MSSGVDLEFRTDNGAFLDFAGTGITASLRVRGGSVKDKAIPRPATAAPALSQKGRASDQSAAKPPKGAETRSAPKEKRQARSS